MLIGSTAAWPLVARAQPSIPVIGYLNGLAAGDRPDLAEAFRQGLNETGYGEGRNVAIEYRHAENQSDRLGVLAADLVARKVAVIAAVGGNNTALVAKRLTSTIPILFTSGADPVKAGLVASINRPEANVTGVSWFSSELAGKHLEMLNELLPQAKVIALLMDPANPEGGIYAQSAHDGAGAFGQRLLVLKAGTPDEIDAAFATLAQEGAHAVIVSAGPFYPARARQLAGLATRFAVPMLSAQRDMPAGGGLLSYGNSVPDAYRRVGIYAGRILDGAKPADLPVDRATKFELVINLATAKALGIDVPPMLLGRADEVIE
jgi:putative ABC transport system substrate-binding protein